MAIAKLLVTQTGADTFTTGLLPLPSLDGKSAYNIKSLQAYWADSQSVNAGDWKLDAVVQAQSTVATFIDDEWIVNCSWAAQNTAGVAVLIPVEPMKQEFVPEERLTVQTAIYCAISSTGTTQANDVIFRVQYEIIKISELDYLRLLAGGA